MSFLKNVEGVVALRNADKPLKLISINSGFNAQVENLALAQNSSAEKK